MANNPYVNKVVLANGTTLIDLTSDTVEAGKMLSGYTAHDKSGATVTGSIASKSSSDLQMMGLMMVAPAGYYAQDGTKTISTISVSTNEELDVINGGYLEISTWQQGSSVEVSSYSEEQPHLILANGAWYTQTPTAYGTYYGKVVVSAGSILQAAYPVGSLYATESSSDNPATILGFGTWTKYAPMDLTWNDTDLDWNNTVGVTNGIYVWKRTA